MLACSYAGCACNQLRRAPLRPAWVRSLINQEAYKEDAVGRERSLLATKQLTVKVADMPHTDLLSHLPEAVDFISAALEGGGSCLVHCMAGVSRSATVRCSTSTPLSEAPDRLLQSVLPV